MRRSNIALAIGVVCWLAAPAFAQTRVEGIVRWADGAPAAGVTVILNGFTPGERREEPPQRRTTDQTAAFAFDHVRWFIRASLQATLGTRVVGRAYTLLTFAVERVDVTLVGTAERPFETASVLSPPAPTAAVTNGDVAGSSASGASAPMTLTGADDLAKAADAY